MPNTITFTAQALNTVKPLEYRHPNTGSWQDSNVLTSVNPGTYTGLMCRLKGSNPAITAVWPYPVTVTGTTTTPPPSSATYTATYQS
jgi:hypothetical protein